MPLPAEVGGSQQSSPSKVGSQVPLLRGQISQRSSLLKFPSGLSAVSNHENPMFDSISEHEASFTRQSVLPQHVGSWELQSQLITQQAFAQAQQAAAQAAAAAAAAQPRMQNGAAAAAAAAAQAAADEDAGWLPDVVAMMERKGATGRAGSLP